MLRLISLGFLIWSIFSPINASIAFICLFAVVEGWFLFLDMIKSPDLQLMKSKYCLTDSELRVFNKYYIFYKFPNLSSKTSVAMSGFQYSAFLWVPWLLYNRLWILAIVTGLNFFLANYLSKKLKPLLFAFHANPKDPIYREKKDINSVYELVVWGRDIRNKNNDNSSLVKDSEDDLPF